MAEATVVVAAVLVVKGAAWAGVAKGGVRWDGAALMAAGWVGAGRLWVVVAVVTAAVAAAPVGIGTPCTQSSCESKHSRPTEGSSSSLTS